jgi:hypothetical protein
MRHSDINHVAIGRAVRDLGQRFHTRDVSEHLAVADAHRAFVDEPAYHALVGKVGLSRESGRLGLRLVKTGGKRGALWERV